MLVFIYVLRIFSYDFIGKLVLIFINEFVGFLEGYKLESGEDDSFG